MNAIEQTWKARHTGTGLELRSGSISCSYSRGEYRVSVRGKVVEIGYAPCAELKPFLSYLSNQYGRA